LVVILKKLSIDEGCTKIIDGYASRLNQTEVTDLTTLLKG